MGGYLGQGSALGWVLPISYIFLGASKDVCGYGLLDHGCLLSLGLGWGLYCGGVLRWMVIALGLFGC